MLPLPFLPVCRFSMLEYPVNISKCITVGLVRGDGDITRGSVVPLNMLLNGPGCHAWNDDVSDYRLTDYNDADMEEIYGTFSNFWKVMQLHGHYIVPAWSRVELNKRLHREGMYTYIGHGRVVSLHDARVVTPHGTLHGCVLSYIACSDMHSVEHTMCSVVKLCSMLGYDVIYCTSTSAIGSSAERIGFGSSVFDSEDGNAFYLYNFTHSHIDKRHVMWQP